MRKYKTQGNHIFDRTGSLISQDDWSRSWVEIERDGLEVFSYHPHAMQAIPPRPVFDLMQMGGWRGSVVQTNPYTISPHF